MVHNFSLYLTCTSNLMPGNPAWAKLAEAHELVFGEYGDWASALLQGDKRALAWVFFLEDVVTPEQVADARSDQDLRDLLSPILSVLDARVAGGGITLVAFFTQRADSPIRSSRQRSPWQRLAGLLVDALYLRNGVWLLNGDDAVAVGGRAGAFDSRNWYVAHCRLSAQGLRALASGLREALERITAPPRKLLVLDCDNTLWGGVVGESGVFGLNLGEDGIGAAFTDFQRVARRLSAQGTILALASKNNEPDVWEVFEQHPGMALRRQDITAWRINWNTKAENIVAIADDLDLGLDSFVFWDDNPLEREQMRLRLPSVLVPEIPADVTLWPAFLDTLTCFAAAQVSEDDRRKSGQYRARAEFVSERRVVVDENAFLRSIALSPTRVSIGAASLGRATQLCAKTNQFNLRTIRHREADVLALAQQPSGSTFLVSLKDSFGDHGIVGLAMARETSVAEIAFLDTFLLSCRVLGRHLEAWVLAEVCRDLARKGVKWLVAEFLSSGKNSVAQEFLPDYGLKALSDLPAEAARELRNAVEEFIASDNVYALPLTDLSFPHLDLYPNVDTVS